MTDRGDDSLEQMTDRARDERLDNQVRREWKWDKGVESDESGTRKFEELEMHTRKR